MKRDETDCRRRDILRRQTGAGEAANHMGSKRFRNKTNRSNDGLFIGQEHKLGDLAEKVHRVQLYVKIISRNLLIEEVIHVTHSVCCCSSLIFAVRMEALSLISRKP